MNFLFPGFLIALTAIAVPIIIHLFRFRRFKKVYFTNVSLLREVNITRKNRQQLKHLLVLLMRALAIAALVFAFAKPFLDATPGAVKPGTRYISVYVDNSYSMDREGQNGNLLNHAKQMAEEIANAYSPTDKFQLLTNDFEGRHARFYPRDEFLNLLGETDFSPTGRKMSEAVNRQRDLLKKEAGESAKRIYLLSDFSESITDFDAIVPDSSIAISLLPLKAEITANVYIDSVWLQTPNTGVNIPLTLKYRLRNTGELEADDVPVKLFVNGEQKTPSVITVPGKGSAEGELYFTAVKTGPQNGKVQIEDQSLEFDNEFYFSFNVAKTLNVLVLSEGGAKAPEKVFAGDDYFKLTTFSTSATDYSRFAEQNLIILNGISSTSGGLVTELKKYADAGGNIAIFPSARADVNSINQLNASLGIPLFSGLRSGQFKAEKVNTEGNFFSDIFESVPKNPDLPVVKQYFPISGGKNTETVIRLNTGDVLYAYAVRDNGSKVFYSSAPLEDAATNFHQHALFVPVLLKTAFLSQRTGPLFYYAGGFAPAEIPVPSDLRNDDAVKWIQTETKYEFIPEQRRSMGRLLFYPGEYLEQAGNYNVMAGNNEIASVAYNYPRTESETKFFTEENLKAELNKAELPYAELLNGTGDTLKKSIEDRENGSDLWKWLAVAALLFLLSEVVLLRVWK
jgi:hypothetical protein